MIYNKLHLCCGYLLICFIGSTLVYGNRVQFVWLETIGGRRMDKIENVDGDACSEHDNQVHKCRKSGCQYNCADNTCNAASADLCPECANFCHDICPCKLSTAGCQYNVLVGACRPSKGGGGGHNSLGGLAECSCGLFENGECARPNAIYANGGELCINRHYRGQCTIDQTIVAVNTGDGHRLVHSNGINYQADHEVPYTDPHHTRDVLSFGTQCVCVGEEQENLYKMIVVGKVSKVGAGNCLTYDIPLCLDGLYELVIHTVEFFATAPRMRMFNVKFNGVLILPEIDPFILGHGAKKPVEIHINFQVTNNGTSLRIPGHRNTAIPEGGSVTLSFCYGECKDVKHREYVIAGFAVVRFLEQSELLRQVAPLRSLDIKNITGTQSCGRHGGNTCNCKKASCETNLITDSCEPSKLCLKKSARQCDRVMGYVETEHLNLAGCHRHDVYYADGGVICKSMDDLGDCSIDQVIMAVKTPLIEGNTIVDSRGVEYSPSSIVKDPQDIYFCENLQTQKDNCPNLVNIIEHAGDRQIYESQITAKESKVGGKGCYGIAFHKPLDQDGKYELSLKLIESKFSSQNKRGFQIMFNDILIVAEMNILQYVSKCEPLELIIPFQITEGGKIITIQGFPPMPLMQGHDLKLAFCYGDCTSHPIPVLSAFYVARMGQLE